MTGRCNSGPRETDGATQELFGRSRPPEAGILAPPARWSASTAYSLATPREPPIISAVVHDLDDHDERAVVLTDDRVEEAPEVR